jgi:hypothetical protein
MVYPPPLVSFMGEYWPFLYKFLSACDSGRFDVGKKRIQKKNVMHWQF